MHSNPSETDETYPKQVAWSSAELVEQIMASASEASLESGGTAEARAGIVAIGKQGCNILNALSGRLPFLGLSIAINSDATLLDRAKADRRVLIGHGECSHPNDRVVRRAMESALPEIEDAIADLHLVFLIVDMTEMVGCAIAPTIARTLVKQCAISFAFVTVPGNLESNPIAVAGICELQNQAISILPFFQMAPGPRCALGEVIGPAVVAFSQLWRGIVLAMWGHSTANIDIEDMRHILSKPGCCVAGFGSGADIKMAIESALHKFSIPSLSQGVLQRASSFLLVIGGQPRDHEVSRKMVAGIRGNLSSVAMTCSGEYIDERLDGSVTVFVLACGVGSCVDSFVICDPVRTDERLRK